MPTPFQNLYIHVPFCRKKCDYCAFYSRDVHLRADRENWLAGLESDLAENRERLNRLNAIHIGGGTPSLLEPELLTRLAAALAPLIHPSTEVTLEANPETITEQIAQIIASFASRVSMGIQSFSTRFLRTIGRHTGAPETVPVACRFLRDAGIRNLSFDLIYAIPGETIADFQADLDAALLLEPQHISAYSLTLEEGTALIKGKHANISPVSDDLSAKMWQFAGDYLARRGFPRYEISNYAQPQYRARYNCNVWRGETYLGLGPAASSFDGIDRWTQPDSLSKWLKRVPPKMDAIPRDARIREILVMGLRTAYGWRDTEFADATGVSWHAFAGTISLLKQQKLLVCSAHRLRPTKKGLLFWNSIAEELL